MPDLLIRKVDPHLRRQIEERARKNRHSLSTEAKSLIRQGLLAAEKSASPEKFGTWLFSLVPKEARGDDLVFEIDDRPKPAEFE